MNFDYILSVSLVDFSPEALVAVDQGPLAAVKVVPRL